MDIEPAVREQLDEIYSRLETFKKEIESHPYDHDQGGFFQVFIQLQEYLSSVKDPKVCEMFFHSERYAENESFFVEHNNYFMRAIETVQAMDISSNHLGTKNSISDFITEKYLAKRYAVAHKKLERFDLSAVKKFVMVGCGPFPDTSLYVFEHTNIETIVNLDNNEEAVFLSSQLISNLGFSQIQTKNIAGEDYDYSDADAIYISGFVRPKQDVLSRIAETSFNEDVQILVNTNFGLKEMLIESVNEKNLHHRLYVDSSGLMSNDSYWLFNMIKLGKYNI